VKTRSTIKTEFSQIKGNVGYNVVHAKLKLKTNLYSAIKSEDSEALDGGTSRLSSQRGMVK